MLLQAHAIAERYNLVAPVVEQPEYHLLARGRVEREYAPLYPNSSMGLGLTTWSPLASGVLTGKYSAGIPAGSRLSRESFKNRADYKAAFLAKIQAAERLRGTAEALGCSMGQLALAWCMANPNVSTVITGATSLKQVEENLGALDVLDRLSSKVLSDIDDALGEDEVGKAASLAAAKERVENQLSFRFKLLTAGAISKL